MQEAPSTVSGGSSLARPSVPTFPFTPATWPDRPHTCTQLHQLICEFLSSPGHTFTHAIGPPDEHGPWLSPEAPQEPPPSPVPLSQSSQEYPVSLTPTPGRPSCVALCTLVFHQPPRFCLSDLHPHLHASPPPDGEAGPGVWESIGQITHLLRLHFLSLQFFPDRGMGTSVGMVRNCFACD